MLTRSRCLLVWILVAAAVPAASQSPNNQVWVEYMVNYPFANSWNVELAATYSTLLESPRWQALDIQVTPEYALSPYVDLQGAFLYNRTNQYQSLSSTEVRTMLGTRIHLTPFSRVLTRLLLRFEHRNLYYEETGTSEQSYRGRLRLETLTALNKKTMYDGDNLWYAVADVETFVVMDQQVNERFANRFRIRIGPGYRLSYTWRFEFLYTYQLSRNTIAGDVDSDDNLFRFRVKHFLHKSKPAQMQGNGN